MTGIFSKKNWFLSLVLIGIIIIGLIIVVSYYENRGWARTLGGPDIHLISLMYSYPIPETSDGGYVAVGEIWTDIVRNPNGEILDYIPRVYLTKVDANGNQWNKTLGMGVGESVIQTSDGGYIITANFPGKDGFYIIKTDAEGNMLWNRTHEVCNWSKHSSLDRTYSIQQTSDGGYIIAGKTFRCDFFSSDDGFLFKVDSNGNKIWEKIFGESRNSSRYDSANPTKEDWLFSAYQTSDGGYIAFGTTNSFSKKTLLIPEYSNASYYPSEFWLIKTDANGNMVLNKTFGEYASYLVDQTSDRGYVASRDSHVFKFDENGNKLWNKTFEFIHQYEPKFGVIQSPFHQTFDGGFVAVAAKGTEDHKKIIFYIVKLDEEGNMKWYKNVFVGDAPIQSASVQQTADGGYIISGMLDTIVTNGVPYFYLIKTDANGNV